MNYRKQFQDQVAMCSFRFPSQDRTRPHSSLNSITSVGHCIADTITHPVILSWYPVTLSCQPFTLSCQLFTIFPKQINKYFPILIMQIGRYCNKQWLIWPLSDSNPRIPSRRRSERFTDSAIPSGTCYSPVRNRHVTVSAAVWWGCGEDGVWGESECLFRGGEPRPSLSHRVLHIFSNSRRDVIAYDTHRVTEG